MRNLRTGIAIALTLALVAPTLAAAQEGTITWIINYTAEPGRGSELVEMITDFWGEATEAQIEAGNVSGWGIASATNYIDGATHVEWLNYPNWEAAARAEEAWRELLEATTDAERNSLRRGMSDLLERRSTNGGVSRSVVRRIAVDPGPFRYFVLGTFVAKAGQASAGTRLFQEEAAPVYEKLLAQGTIDGYGMAVPALHNGLWTHYTWYAIQDLSALDAIHSALGTILDEDLERRVAQIFDESLHRDTLFRVVHLGGAGSD